MARYRRQTRSVRAARPFPTAGEDKLRAHAAPDTPQTRSPAYLLGFANNDLLLRDELRSVRLQLEFLKPDLLQEDRGVETTVAVFGSSRILPPDEAATYLKDAEELAALNPGDPHIAAQLRTARTIAKKAVYYEEARLLAQMISATQLPTKEQQAQSTDTTCEVRPDRRTAVFVVTGGGPGIMEAANRGAHDVGAESIAHNIVLPFEQRPNKYITPELCFNFHYFALRKLHFMLRSVALVVFPGGFGTLDELFEVLTLIQTHKIKPIPVLLFGRQYWERIIDFQALVDEGMIMQCDLDIFTYVETAEEAWRILEPTLRQATATFSHTDEHA
ncbi:MAG: LOG family protein [Thermoleophilia bacterium]|jgi:uncharacterized protein (TIGR00730 family)